MDARISLLLSLVALSCAAGCCCDPCGGGSCLPRMCRPYEERIMADDTQCGTCCRTVGCGGGIKQWLHNKGTHCRGCGDIYWGEWISDPPDCCDPCDQCGSFTGAGVCCDAGCGSGILCRLANLFRGRRYNPGPCGRVDCGGIGCDACGHDGLAHDHMPGPLPHGSILQENWDPKAGPKPLPGKPIHKADTPHSLR